MSPHKDFEVALIRFEVYNSMFNITAGNNLFYYSNGTQNRTITFSPGAYEIAAINTELLR